MKINFIHKLKLLFRIYIALFKMNSKTALKVLFKPAETTRYVEFAYILEFFKRNNINIENKSKILDISSPFVLSYVLSRKSKVIKTDINEDEKLSIKENENLKFKIEDATNLTFENNTFDLVYSISVIEHIYKNYLIAVKEMIRVTRHGGIIYLTFPVSNSFKEEWIEFDIYSHQYKNGRKTFFQYRFDEEKTNEILNNISGVEILRKDIFWERKNGLYDKIIEKLRKYPGNNLKNYFINSLINFYAGFRLLDSKPKDFNSDNSFGNISIIMKKI